jgi:TusA-related sulfurtransferase
VQQERVQMSAVEASPPDSRMHTLNLCGVPCPLNLVKAKLAIEKIGLGETIEIALDDGEPIRNLPVSLGRQGQEIIETITRDGHFCVKVRRRL